MLKRWRGADSRTTGQPWGVNPSDKEVEANTTAIFIFELCKIQSQIQLFFSIENPRNADLWPALSSLGIFEFCEEVVFVQCMFGSNFNRDPVMKPTKLITNVTYLRRLSRRCDRSHVHRTAFGRVAAAAATYPRQLCSAWAEGLRELS